MSPGEWRPVRMQRGLVHVVHPTDLECGELRFWRPWYPPAAAVQFAFSIHSSRWIRNINESFTA
jgi:hypothetical protein